MKVERFGDLICWQKARALTKLVNEWTRRPLFKNDFELVRQIRGAGISTMSNIAEGFDRWSRKEFIRFLDIAKGSAGEVRSQLYVALDQQYLSAAEFEQAYANSLEVSKTIGGLIGHLVERTAGYKVNENQVDEPTDTELPAEFVNVGTDPNSGT